MTAKGLFWILVGPALWTAILLLIASDTAHGVMEIAELSAEPGFRQVVEVPDRALRVDALAAAQARRICVATATRRFTLPPLTQIRAY